MFVYVNSYLGLWKVGMMVGVYVVSWFINGGKILFKFGVISDWMEVCDFFEVDGESFCSWFKKYQVQEKKNG